MGGVPLDSTHWEVDGGVVTVTRRRTRFLSKYIPDSYLRPLRDTDGEDEMIAIAGKPPTEQKVNPKVVTGTT